ncbi:hypothetical protein NP493_1458g00018 [Ridgeia piscesae]|uniref:Uncharacterized protein n=1 Tax=Ridgeia piscesae TaxID=27915 RepID=A0AAD9NDS7_RIDPI|nr:hypothetical protein NP493_1458g00018 [Ridgeia piscesae]
MVTDKKNASFCEYKVQEATSTEPTSNTGFPYPQRTIEEALGEVPLYSGRNVLVFDPNMRQNLLTQLRVKRTQKRTRKRNEEADAEMGTEKGPEEDTEEDTDEDAGVDAEDGAEEDTEDDTKWNQK